MISKSTYSLADMPFNAGAFEPSIQIRSVQFECPLAQVEGGPAVSFVIPVHNQAARIQKILSSIQANAALAHEFVIVVDGCSDDSLAQVTRWAEQIYASAPALTSSITVLEISEGVFETLADAIGIERSVGEVVIEIQADMEFDHLGFDKMLVSALKQDDRLFLVSGRGTHPFFKAAVGTASVRRRIWSKGFDVMERLFTQWYLWRGEYRPSRLEFRLSGKAGRIGKRMEVPQDKRQRPRLYLSETVMRGPIAMRRQRYLELGGFDTQHFFLGNDDHDIAMRGLVLKGWRTGYVPISFNSPLDQGSTRAIRTPASAKRFAELQEYYRKAFSESFLANHLADYPRLRKEELSLEGGPQ